MASRTARCDEAASDGGRRTQPLGDYAGVVRNRESEGPAGAPRACATCLESLQPARIGVENSNDGAGRIWGASIPTYRRMTIKHSRARKTTWSTAC